MTASLGTKQKKKKKIKHSSRAKNGKIIGEFKKSTDFRTVKRKHRFVGNLTFSNVQHNSTKMVNYGNNYKQHFFA